MNKRVYGVIGVKSIMANWNADFSGCPKTISTGEIFGSDKALKYPMKKMWENEGEKVLYIKSFKLEPTKGGKKSKKDEITEESKVAPKSLKERYEELFNIKNLKEEKDSKKVLTNLFDAIDVKNFGATFAEEGNNISITGAVQIGQGFNKYQDTTVEEQQILSPFRVENAKNKSKGEEASSTTLGTKIVSNEAHYFYPFAINPTSYKNYQELGVTTGYSEEDYKKFKEVALVAATAQNTNSKMGCENEFALFVETDMETYLPDLAQFITFEKGEERDIIDLTKIGKLICQIKEKVKAVEEYYNPFTTNLGEEIEKAKYFNIFTREEVK
jgi:CRISPR-associated protein Csh2